MQVREVFSTARIDKAKKAVSVLPDRGSSGDGGVAQMTTSSINLSVHCGGLPKERADDCVHTEQGEDQRCRGRPRLRPAYANTTGWMLPTCEGDARDSL